MTRLSKNTWCCSDGSLFMKRQRWCQINKMHHQNKPLTNTGIIIPLKMTQILMSTVLVVLPFVPYTSIHIFFEADSVGLAAVVLLPWGHFPCNFKNKATNTRFWVRILISSCCSISQTISGSSWCSRSHGSRTRSGLFIWSDWYGAAESHCTHMGNEY